MEEKMTYKSAFDELQEILKNIESGEVEIDELSKHIKRASELLGFCKNSLRDIETDINDIMKEN